MAAIRSALATLLWASPASSVLLSGAARPLASCRVAAPVCLAEQVKDAVVEDPEVMKARTLAGLQSQAVQWLAMSSAIDLSDGEGLQPFAVPQGWMAAPSAPPAQSFTNDELSAEIERREPALLALLKACAERAPSLCTPSAMLPLARLAAWTERDAWVRPLDEWEGEGDGSARLDLGGDAGAGSSEGAAKEASKQAREAAALRGLTAHLLEKWEVPEALHSALGFVDGPPEPDP